MTPDPLEELKITSVNLGKPPSVERGIAAWEKEREELAKYEQAASMMGAEYMALRAAIEKVRERVRIEGDGFADPGEDCREHSLMVARLLKEIYDALDAALTSPSDTPSKGS